MNMHPISDNELVLYFYRDGLDARRIAEIDDALFAAPELRRRYTALQRLLHEIDAAPVVEPDAEFSQRVWRRLAARIDAQAPRRAWRSRIAALVRVPSLRAAFAAAVLALAVLGGYEAGRLGAPDADERTRTAASRILDAYVAAHLRSTEGLLLTAANSDSAELRAADHDLASALVESNRLYAAAAARDGNTRLADFLRQLEPVLIELANRPRDAPVQSIEDLRGYLRETDLLFKVRATEARLGAAETHRT
ncbi:MAG TPA: hypothetical protein VFB32_15195 [Rudaea sp.]|nr:hypothetical protein [Rudaea sp.]